MLAFALAAVMAPQAQAQGDRTTGSAPASIKSIPDNRADAPIDNSDVHTRAVIQMRPLDLAQLGPSAFGDWNVQAQPASTQPLTQKRR